MSAIGAAADNLREFCHIADGGVLVISKITSDKAHYRNQTEILAAITNLNRSGQKQRFLIQFYI